MFVPPVVNRQPSLYSRMLVRGVVVDHQMDIQSSRHVFINVLQKAQILLMRVSGFALRNDLAIRDVQSSE